MRLFVAVDIGAPVAQAADALMDQLRGRASRLAPGARISWIPPERLHLTVRFIGHVDEENAGIISAALEPALPAQPFSFTIAGAGAFPSTGQPRVIWAGVGRGLESLQAVEKLVTARLAAAGIPPEDRPYRPHLTLARVRDAAGLRSSTLFEDVGAAVLGQVAVEAITLYESRLSPKGPTYVPLQQTKLQAG